MDDGGNKVFSRVVDVDIIWWHLNELLDAQLVHFSTVKVVANLRTFQRLYLSTFPTERLLGFRGALPWCRTPLWSFEEKHVWTWGTPCSHVIQLTHRLTGWQAVAACCSRNPLHFHLSERERGRKSRGSEYMQLCQLHHEPDGCSSDFPHVGIPAVSFPNSRNVHFTLMMSLELFHVSFKP